MRRLALLVLGATMTWSVAARASNPVAEQLFVEGKTLMQQNRFTEACAKFKASYALDTTATGTLLNLALCHEQVGKVASAWSEFRQVAGESASKRQDRVDIAREHEAKLRPLLSHVTFVVANDAKVEGLTLKLDGENPIAPGAWGTPVPIDPGKHVLETSAPNKVTAKREFEVASQASEQSVVVAPLADAPRTVAITTVDADALKTRRTIGFALGGVGIVAIGFGAYFGLHAIGKNNDAVDRCPNDHCKSSDDARQSTQDLSSAKSSATGSTILVGAGIGALAGGLALVLFSRPKNPETAVRMNIQPGGLSLSGAW